MLYHVQSQLEYITIILGNEATSCRLAITSQQCTQHSSTPPEVAGIAQHAAHQSRRIHPPQEVNART